MRNPRYGTIKKRGKSGYLPGDQFECGFELWRVVAHADDGVYAVLSYTYGTVPYGSMKREAKFFGYHK